MRSEGGQPLNDILVNLTHLLCLRKHLWWFISLTTSGSERRSVAEDESSGSALSSLRALLYFSPVLLKLSVSSFALHHDGTSPRRNLPHTFRILGPFSTRRFPIPLSLSPSPNHNPHSTMPPFAGHNTWYPWRRVLSSHLFYYTETPRSSAPDRPSRDQPVN